MNEILTITCVPTDRERESKPKRKEEKTEMVRIRRFNPGLVFRMVFGSNCESPASDDPESSCGGSEGSEISPIAELNGSSAGLLGQLKLIHRSLAEDHLFFTFGRQLLE